MMITLIDSPHKIHCVETSCIAPHPGTRIGRVVWGQEAKKMRWGLSRKINIHVQECDMLQQIAKGSHPKGTEGTEGRKMRWEAWKDREAPGLAWILPLRRGPRRCGFDNPRREKWMLVHTCDGSRLQLSPGNRRSVLTESQGKLVSGKYFQRVESQVSSYSDLWKQRNSYRGPVYTIPPSWFN